MPSSNNIAINTNTTTLNLKAGRSPHLGIALETKEPIICNPAGRGDNSVDDSIKKPSTLLDESRENELHSDCSSHNAQGSNNTDVGRCNNSSDAAAMDIDILHIGRLHTSFRPTIMASSSSSSSSTTRRISSTFSGLRSSMMDMTLDCSHRAGLEESDTSRAVSYNEHDLDSSDVAKASSRNVLEVEVPIGTLDRATAAATAAKKRWLKTPDETRSISFSEHDIDKLDEPEVEAVESSSNALQGHQLIRADSALAKMMSARSSVLSNLLAPRDEEEQGSDTSSRSREDEERREFVQHWEKQALKHFQNSAWEEVVTACKKVLTMPNQSTTNFDILYEIGYAYMRLEQYELAAPYFRSAHRIDSKRIPLRLAIGDLRRRMQMSRRNRRR